MPENRAKINAGPRHPLVTSSMSSSYINNQVTEQHRRQHHQQQQQQQWHVDIKLTDFVAHVSNLQHIVDMCNTSELSSIKKEDMKRIMGWGAFIEEVR